MPSTPSTSLSSAFFFEPTKKFRHQIVISHECDAMYDFEASDSDEFSFREGETLIIIEKIGEWYRGKSARRAGVGLFPANYVGNLRPMLVGATTRE